LEGKGRSYDAMVHVYGRTSRTIAFRETSGGPVWIHEQEIYTGPRSYDTPDGRQQEHICLTYETEAVSGATPNRLKISYSGPDKRLSEMRELTLPDVQQTLVSWSK